MRDGCEGLAYRGFYLIGQIRRAADYAGAEISRLLPADGDGDREAIIMRSSCCPLSTSVELVNTRQSGSTKDQAS